MNSTRRNVLRAAGGVGLGMAVSTLPVAASARSDEPREGPRIGILLYDKFALLDAMGPAEFLSRLPDATIVTIAEETGPVRVGTGDVAVYADRSIDEAPQLDVLLLPGGDVRDVVENRRVMDWIGEVHQTTRWTTSVCTGALILGHAGLLEGRPATTYWASADYLESLGATYVHERYVHDGKIVTAAGVSAGCDMALYLASVMFDDRTAQTLQLAVEYDPQPPFDSGDSDDADDELKELALKLLRDSER